MRYNGSAGACATQGLFRTGCVTVNMKKILTWAVVAFLLFFLFSAPDQASNAVNGILASLRGAAEAVITFMQNLFQA